MPHFEGLSNCKLRQIKCAKWSCTRSVSSSKHCAEMRWGLEGGGFTDLSSDRLKQSSQPGGAPSRRIGGASLEEEGVAGVADSHRFWWGGQRELIVGAAVTENLPTVPTVMLERETQRESQDHDFSSRFYLSSFDDSPSVLRWRTPSRTACSGWLPCPSTKPDPPETKQHAHKSEVSLVNDSSRRCRAYAGLDFIIWSSFANILPNVLVTERL